MDYFASDQVEDKNKTPMAYMCQTILHKYYMSRSHTRSVSYR